MPGITGMGTTYNLPNFVGQLFQITPSDTPLLSLTGGVSGGEPVKSVKFGWQTKDLRARTQPSALEGANAPTAVGRRRTSVENVVQIHQSKVEVSYTKQAATGQLATPQAAPFITADGSPNPVVSELDEQVADELKSMAGDINFSFWNGELRVPTDNTTGRRTQGLLGACTSNKIVKGTALTDATTATDTITITHALSAGDKVIFTKVGEATGVVAGRVYYVKSVSTTVSFKVTDVPGGTAITLGTATVSLVVPWTTTLTTSVFEDLVQQIWDQGGLREGMGTVCVGSTQKRALTAAYADAYGKADVYVGSRNVAGVNLQQIETDLAVLNVMLDTDLPPDAIAIISAEMIKPKLLEIPDKGFLFAEPLAKTGSSDAVQLYGEVGLEWGNEKAHGVLRGLKI